MSQACSLIPPLFLSCPRFLTPQNSLLEPPSAQLYNKNNRPATYRAVAFKIPSWPFSFWWTLGPMESWRGGIGEMQ